MSHNVDPSNLSKKQTRQSKRQKIELWFDKQQQKFDKKDDQLFLSLKTW